MSEFLQITTTAGNREEADRIATTLVDRRLAACVQIIGPIRFGNRYETSPQRLSLGGANRAQRGVALPDQDDA